MEPQVNQLVSHLAGEAIDRSSDLARRAYKRAKNQPLYLVGGAAVLLVGAAITLGIQKRQHQLSEHYVH